jgi:hypothetical protein
VTAVAVFVDDVLLVELEVFALAEVVEAAVAFCSAATFAAAEDVVLAEGLELAERTGSFPDASWTETAMNAATKSAAAKHATRRRIRRARLRIAVSLSRPSARALSWLGVRVASDGLLGVDMGLLSNWDLGVTPTISLSHQSSLCRT